MFNKILIANRGEIALRVIVERNDWQFEVVGTATLISGHLAITANHVLEHALRKYGALQKDGKLIEIDAFELKLWQVLPGPIYRTWKVFAAWPCATDVVILHLGLDRTSLPDQKIEWKQPRLRVLPPPVGETVVAFGYRESHVRVTEGDGQHHIELNDRPTTSIGKIREVYSSGRDSVMLPFPCFEIEARFDPGMSGGVVIDEAGAVCGLICASLQQSDVSASPISYVASLWPMLNTLISANRGDGYPKDVSYPVIDLAIDGLICVTDLHNLDPAHFPDKQLSK